MQAWEHARTSAVRTSESMPVACTRRASSSTASAIAIAVAW